MTLLLVLMTCGVYRTGCGETTNAYYQSEPGIQEAAKRMETIVKNKLSDDQVTGMSMAYQIIRNKDLAIPITSNVNLKLNTQTADAFVLYSVPY